MLGSRVCETFHKPASGGPVGGFFSIFALRLLGGMVWFRDLWKETERITESKKQEKFRI